MRYIYLSIVKQHETEILLGGLLQRITTYSARPWHDGHWQMISTSKCLPSYFLPIRLDRGSLKLVYTYTLWQCYIALLQVSLLKERGVPNAHNISMVRKTYYKQDADSLISYLFIVLFWDRTVTFIAINSNIHLPLSPHPSLPYSVLECEIKLSCISSATGTNGNLRSLLEQEDCTL